ncbi:MAG: flagellar motor switch protein FliN [Eubacteriales bacterium]|nr:flagellar motor switch protein FliN [Eubacteriales bacterium]MDN5363890.1 flagellar motor switch protein FliN [Eubacteriales bacterium]
MNEDVLSQEEIDALLRATLSEQEGGGSGGGETTSGTPELSEKEKDALGELANMVMGAAATALSELVDRKVEITTPEVKVTTVDRLQQDYPLPCLLVDVRYIKGLEGLNALFIKLKDAAIIVDLMMGGDGLNPPEELGEIHLSAISEAMNQMMGAAASTLNSFLGRPVEFSPPKVNVIDMAAENVADTLGAGTNDVVVTSFKIKIERLVDSEMLQIIPYPAAKAMAAELLAATDRARKETAASTAAASAPAASAAPGGADENMKKKEKQVNVHPVQFAPLEDGSRRGEPANIDLILDVPLQVTVELGRTKKTIKEILALGPGSVIELDKLAGEPVDLLVNGKLLAKGEVVVIDENFGIRVTDIISPMERLNNLQ